MPALCRYLVLALAAWAIGIGSVRAEDPLIGGTPLSKLVAAFKAAKNSEERSSLAFAIADGKEKAASAVPVLAASLKDKDRSVRSNVAGALQSMGPAAKEAVPDLIAALKDTEPLVRAAAMYALASIGSAAKTAIPTISEVLKNPRESDALRAAAANALGDFGKDAKAAAPLLAESLKDKAVKIRVASALSLYQIDQGNAKIVLPVLRGALKSEDERAQTTAVLALKELGSDANDAVPDLIVLLAKGGMPGYYAREALGKIPAAEAGLIASLKSPDKNARDAAANVLIEYYPEAAKKAGLDKAK